MKRKQEEHANSEVADKLAETNQAAAEGVGSIFKELSENAYEDGTKTAQEFLQGIIDSMDGVNGIDSISGIINAGYGYSGTAASSASGGSGGGQQGGTQAVLLTTPITINLNDKAYIETTIGDLINKGRVTGGNAFGV